MLTLTISIFTECKRIIILIVLKNAHWTKDRCFCHFSQWQIFQKMFVYNHLINIHVNVQCTSILGVFSIIVSIYISFICYTGFMDVIAFRLSFFPSDIIFVCLCVCVSQRHILVKQKESLKGRQFPHAQTIISTIVTSYVMKTSWKYNQPQKRWKKNYEWVSVLNLVEPWTPNRCYRNVAIQLDKFRLSGIQKLQTNGKEEGLNDETADTSYRFQQNTNGKTVDASFTRTRFFCIHTYMYIIHSYTYTNHTNNLTISSWDNFICNMLPLKQWIALNGCLKAKTFIG